MSQPPTPAPALKSAQTPSPRATTVTAAAPTAPAAPNAGRPQRVRYWEHMDPTIHSLYPVD